MGGFADRPVIGHGAGSFPLTHLAYRENAIQVRNAHSVPLEFLSETGLIGAALALGGLGAARPRRPSGSPARAGPGASAGSRWRCSPPLLRRVAAPVDRLGLGDPRGDGARAGVPRGAGGAPAGDGALRSPPARRGRGARALAAGGACSPRGGRPRRAARDGRGPDRRGAQPGRQRHARRPARGEREGRARQAPEPVRGRRRCSPRPRSSSAATGPPTRWACSSRRSSASPTTRPRGAAWPASRCSWTTPPARCARCATVAAARPGSRATETLSARYVLYDERRSASATGTPLPEMVKRRRRRAPAPGRPDRPARRRPRRTPPRPPQRRRPHAGARTRRPAPAPAPPREPSGRSVPPRGLAQASSSVRSSPSSMPTSAVQPSSPFARAASRAMWRTSPGRSGAMLGLERRRARGGRGRSRCRARWSRRRCRC